MAGATRATSNLLRRVLKLAVLLCALFMYRVVAIDIATESGTSNAASSPASERDVLNKATTIDASASATGVSKNEHMNSDIADCRCVWRVK